MIKVASVTGVILLITCLVLTKLLSSSDTLESKRFEKWLEITREGFEPPIISPVEDKEEETTTTTKGHLSDSFLQELPIEVSLLMHYAEEKMPRTKEELKLNSATAQQEHILRLLLLLREANFFSLTEDKSPLEGDPLVQISVEGKSTTFSRIVRASRLLEKPAGQVFLKLITLYANK
jgi:hypothetical protein